MIRGDEWGGHAAGPCAGAKGPAEQSRVSKRLRVNWTGLHQHMKVIQPAMPGRFGGFGLSRLCALPVPRQGRAVRKPRSGPRSARRPNETAVRAPGQRDQVQRQRPGPASSGVKLRTGRPALGNLPHGACLVRDAAICRSDCRWWPVTFTMLAPLRAGRTKSFAFPCQSFNPNFMPGFDRFSPRRQGHHVVFA